MKEELEGMKEQLMPVLISKVEEFHLLGYEHVLLSEVWDCLMKRKWRKEREIKLHEIVADIMSLSVGHYMAYATVKTSKETDSWFDGAGLEALDALVND